MKSYLLWILPWYLAFISCSSVRVKQDFDANFDYVNLKQYSWQVVDLNSAAPLDSLVEDRVHSSVDNKLSEKGYKRVEAHQSDFFVNYRYLARDVSENSNSMSAGFGMGTTSGSDSSFGSLGLGLPLGSQRTRAVETLRIEVIDAKSGKLIWHGIAQEKLMDSTPEKTSVNFIKVVNAILAKFPPIGKK